MRNFILIIFACLLFVAPNFAQTSAPAALPAAASPEVKVKKPTFRANKAQILQVQKTMKLTETGKMDDDFRAEIKKYQAGNGLKQTGSLNRATLEKMNVALTDAQKLIPISPDSYASANQTAGDAKPRKPVFRATKDQVAEAQTKLKTGTLYAGEATGKLDDATREGIRKFQAANGVKVTGTLNKETLEKMSIVLTDKQKTY